MSSFSIRPSILLCDTVEELAQKLHIGKGDILFTSGYLYNSMIEPAGLSCEVILRDRYGRGDPNDQMIDEIRADLCGKRFNRIIAIGGGSIIDTAKVLALDEKDTTESIFCGRAHPKKICELVAVPTTCGSGAEITDLAMVQLTVKHTSVTCQMKEFLPDVAALVPELLDTLTNRNFATSSLDALVRAMEAYLSPQASPYSDLFSQKAIELILNGYQYIGRNGPDLWNKKEFLLASNYAGIAFANTGYGPAYLLAGPLARRSSIPRGQVSLIVFRQILALYQKYKPVGKLNLLERQLAELLGTSVDTVWRDLDRLIAAILPYQSLNELGVPHKALWDCMQEALQRRRSAMAHAYTELSENDILRIYEAAYE